MKYTPLTTLAACVVSLAAAAHAVAADIDKLVADATNKDKQVAVPAIDALGKAGAAAKSAVPALVKALANKDEEVRWHAARALGSIGPDAVAAVPALAKALGDESAKVRGYAAFALGEIGDESPVGIDRLIETVFDSDGSVRRASLRALRKIDPPQEKTLPIVLKLLEEGDPAIVMPALHTLAEEGEKVVPRLCGLLLHEKACYWACLALAEIGPKAKAAVPHIKNVLEHKDPEVRMQALVTLGEIGPASKSLAPDIVALLEKDSFDGVRYAAAFAIGKIGTSPESTKALNKALEEDDPFLSMVSAWALARNNPDDKAMVQRAVDLIVKGFKSDDVHLRRAAAKAAVGFDIPLDAVAPILIEALEDKDPIVVGNALEALSELGPKVLGRVDELLKNKDLRYYALPLIARLGREAEPAVPALIDVLKDEPKDEEDVGFQREVQFVLAAIGPDARGAVQALVTSLDSKHEGIVASASFALGKIGPPARGAVPALRRNLKSLSLMVRLASIRALLEILPGERQLGAIALPLFIQGLDKEHHELVRAEAATALGELGSRRALPQLKELLDDESQMVRQAAAEAIAKLEQ